MKHLNLLASLKAAPPGEHLKEIHGRRQFEISIQLPTHASDAEIDQLLQEIKLGKRAPLSIAELKKVLGASSRHVRQVMKSARLHGLSLPPRKAADLAHGIVRVKGTYSRFKKFFPDLNLALYRDDKKQFVGRTGTLKIQTDTPVLGVFGFDDRIAAQPRLRFSLSSSAQNLDSRLPVGLTSRGLAKLQGVPVDELNEIEGVVTGYISLGGDNGRRMQKDIELAAMHDGIAAAKFIGISVDGTSIEGNYSDGATVENALDAQAQALLNPNGYVVAFRAANSDDAFARAQEAANVFEGIKVKGKVLPLAALSISWGMAEIHWTEQSLRRWERAFKAARLRGIIVTSAAGDDGSKDGTSVDTPDAPSCVPHHIGAGGVYIRSSEGKTVDQIGVWNDMPRGGATGGGISALFPLLDEEKVLNLPVSAETKAPGHSASVLADLAAPDSGPQVMYRKQLQQVGGTSHASPFIAIKLALLQAQLGIRLSDWVGFVYAQPKGVFDMVTVAGNNGSYNAEPEDLVNVPLGFGVINWQKLKAALSTESLKAKNTEA